MNSSEMIFEWNQLSPSDSVSYFLIILRTNMKMHFQNCNERSPRRIKEGNRFGFSMEGCYK